MADEYLKAALYGIKRFNEWADKKVKELIWMQKLIELLNKYAYGENKELYYRDGEMVEINSERVISKKFWFIQWLVENEKIDFEKVEKEEEKSDLTISFHNEYEWFYTDYVKQLLMLLSIQDNPIDYLCEILK